MQNQNLVTLLNQLMCHHEIKCPIHRFKVQQKSSGARMFGTFFLSFMDSQPDPLGEWGSTTKNDSKLSDRKGSRKSCVTHLHMLIG